jgi:hypothetical protein
VRIVLSETVTWMCACGAVRRSAQSHLQLASLWVRPLDHVLITKLQYP